MARGLTLRELAETRSWIAFGNALSAAVDDPSRYGCKDASQLLAQVAQLRGVEPASLRNPLAAVNWMKENAPKALREENAKIPMTGVLTLSQISIVSKRLAEELAPKFFSGGVSRRHLQIALRKAETQQGHYIAGHARMKRAVAFEEEVFRFLQNHPAALELGQDIEVVRTERNALVPSDFTVLRDGRAIAVVECKAHRTTLHHRYLLQTLAMAALHMGDKKRSILVVPRSWGHSIQELVDLCGNLHLTGVRIATLENCEGAGPKLIYQEQI